MNKVILMGRLTRDPDIRSSQSDNPITVARFTIAVDRRFKRDSDQSADFISCVAFGKTAEFFDKFVKQGTKVCVEGRIQTGSYTNRDGQKVYTTDVVVENAEFAESKSAQESRSGSYQPQYQQYGQQSQPQYQSQPQQSQNNYNYQPQPAPAPQPAYQNYSQAAAEQPGNFPAEEAAGEGFMSIPDGLEDEGLPFN